MNHMKGATKPAKTRTVCLSHKEDADGICSAALVREAFGGSAVLVDYPGQMEALEEIAAELTLKQLYICDLGLSRKNQDRFVEILSALRKRHVGVTYIDHHDIDPAVTESLESVGVKMVHDIEECTTVQVYHKFKTKLSEHSAFVAACAAITDYMEDRPRGSKLLQIFDRQFALINATVLTYNIVGHQKDMDYLLYLVDELSKSRYPHDLPDTFEFAQEQVKKLADVFSQVKDGTKIMRNLGHMEITDAGASGAVNFVLGLSRRDVGIAYKERTDYGIYAVSIRGSKSCTVHLGKLTNRLAAEVGGSGGGHDRACGAVIPKDKMTAFLRAFNRELD